MGVVCLMQKNIPWRQPSYRKSLPVWGHMRYHFLWFRLLARRLLLGRRGLLDRPEAGTLRSFTCIKHRFLSGWLDSLRHPLSHSDADQKRPISGGSRLFFNIAGIYWHNKCLRGRAAAFVHVGAVVGTIMVATSFFIIIPNQKIVVADLIAMDTGSQD